MPTRVAWQGRTAGAMVVGVCLAYGGTAQAEQPYRVEWSKQIGTIENDINSTVAVDALGNVYFSGSTYGSLAGPNHGSYDVFVKKYDPSGVELWSRQTGSLGSDAVTSMAVDGLGKAYISGYTPASYSGPLAIGLDAFLTKFDPSGVELWSKKIGTTEIDESLSVAVDGVGNVYISGRTEGNLEGLNAGSYDAFLMKLDPSGTELWSQQIGTSANDRGYSVAVDSVGNAYISGSTLGNLGGPSAGSTDVFLMKFDPSGTELWTQQIGTPAIDVSRSVAVDGAGNAYISGYTTGGLGGSNTGSYDAFLTKFDPSGTDLWTQQIGTTTHDLSISVAIDVVGNAYISGYSFGSLGGSNAGSYDAFLTKFDPSGTDLWTQQIGSMDTDRGTSVAVDNAGSVYIGGETHGSLAGPYMGGGADTFLVKFSIPEPSTLALLTLSGFVLLQPRRGA